MHYSTLNLTSPLARQGEEQARYLRDFLSTVKAELVVTSELVRTQETAQIVLEKQALHPPLISVPQLREISWGSMEGTNTADVHGLVQSWNTGDFEGIFSDIICAYYHVQ